jgi:coenzyme F420-reducing hydrogenase beta subunit/polysaccharide pyruvyl transferase WcaK-like protein
MNLYAFVTIATPLLLGVDVVKYSQALGGFDNRLNRTLAKLILPKVRLICARGEATKQNLAEIGIRDNVELCADGAFSMPDDEGTKREVDTLFAGDSFFSGNVVGVSISSVVEARCREAGVDYIGTMKACIEDLISKGYGVLIIANAARMGSAKSRNNDLMVCDAVYAAVGAGRGAAAGKLRWYHEEMSPEKIRELIGRCDALIASRFHAMIAALQRGVPVLVIGWSHKYKEVLDMFELGMYAVDYSGLSAESIGLRFDELMRNKDDIRASLRKNLPKVLESSLRNIGLIGDVFDATVAGTKLRNRFFDFRDPSQYMGPAVGCRVGYAKDEAMRERAASGGMVTTLLCELLRVGAIDGAWVTRSVVDDGAPAYETFVATTREELMDCRSSIYMSMPLVKHIDVVKNFGGRIAVVMLPCQIRALNAMIERDASLREKISLRIALFCSGSHGEGATLSALRGRGISLAGARRMYWRQGHWRGATVVQYHDGSEKRTSYSKGIGAYRNAGFFLERRCYVCQDLFGRGSDIAFGDIWLKEMKSEAVKYNSAVIHTEAGASYYKKVADEGVFHERHISFRRLIMAQKRALVFDFNCAAAKRRHYARSGRIVKLNTANPCRWNHALAAFFMRLNMTISEKRPELPAKIPAPLVYCYMLSIRALLNF